MPDSFTNDALTSWLLQETEHIDLVASWEELCQTYRTMEFVDEINDQTRIEEFKWIVKEVNRFLTAIRKKLLTCESIEAVMDVLHQNFIPAGKVNLDSRKAMAFQKHKQQWILMMLAQAEEIQKRMQEMEAERKGDQDGWSDQSDDYEW